MGYRLNNLINKKAIKDKARNQGNVHGPLMPGEYSAVDLFLINYFKEAPDNQPFLEIRNHIANSLPDDQNWRSILLAAAAWSAGGVEHTKFNKLNNRQKNSHKFLGIYQSNKEHVINEEYAGLYTYHNSLFTGKTHDKLTASVLIHELSHGLCNALYENSSKPYPIDAPAEVINEWEKFADQISVELNGHNIPDQHVLTNFASSPIYPRELYVVEFIVRIVQYKFLHGTDQLNELSSDMKDFMNKAFEKFTADCKAWADKTIAESGFLLLPGVDNFLARGTTVKLNQESCDWFEQARKENRSILDIWLAQSQNQDIQTMISAVESGRVTIHALFKAVLRTNNTTLLHKFLQLADNQQVLSKKIPSINLKHSNTLRAAYLNDFNLFDSEFTITAAQFGNTKYLDMVFSLGKTNVSNQVKKEIIYWLTATNNKVLLNKAFNHFGDNIDLIEQAYQAMSMYGNVSLFAALQGKFPNFFKNKLKTPENMIDLMVINKNYDLLNDLQRIPGLSKKIARVLLVAVFYDNEPLALQQLKKIIKANSLPSSMPHILSLAIARNHSKFVSRVLNHTTLFNNSVDADGVPLLQNAIKCKRPDVIELLLKKGVNTKCLDSSQNNILHVLATINNDRGFTNKVFDLLNKYDNKAIETLVNQMNSASETPINDAINHKNAIFLEILQANGVNINVRNVNGESALMYAVRTDKHQTAKILMNQVQDQNKFKETSLEGDNLLHLVARNNNVELCKELLQHITSLSYMLNNQGELPIITAMKAGSEEVAEVLANAFKVDNYLKLVNLSRTFFDLILIEACKADSLSVFRAFINRFGDITKRLNNYHSNYLSAPELAHVAVEHGSLNILNELASMPGFDKNTKCMNGNTLLHTAAQSHDNKTTQAVLNLVGADLVNATNIDGNTALIFSAGNNDYHSTRLLINAQTDVNIQNKISQTATHVAATQNSIESLTQLIATAGIDLELTDDLGETALVKALKHGHSAAAMLLIQAGANIHVTDHHGTTAFELAQQRGLKVSRHILAKVLQEKFAEKNMAQTKDTSASQENKNTIEQENSDQTQSSNSTQESSADESSADDSVQNLTNKFGDLRTQLNAYRTKHAKVRLFHSRQKDAALLITKIDQMNRGDITLGDLATFFMNHADNIRNGSIKSILQNFMQENEFVQYQKDRVFAYKGDAKLTKLHAYIDNRTTSLRYKLFGSYRKKIDARTELASQLAYHFKHQNDPDVRTIATKLKGTRSKLLQIIGEYDKEQSERNSITQSRIV